MINIYSLRQPGFLTLLFNLLILCLLNFLPAQDNNYDKGKASWQQGNYPQALEYLLSYRQQPYGRMPEVDYMIGTSACRVPGKEGKGARILEWMLYAYPLTQPTRERVVSEKNNCQLNTNVQVSVEDIEGEISAGMSARGKTFYWTDRDMPINSYPARYIGKRDIEKFRKRLVKLDQQQMVVEKLKNRFPESEIYGSKRIILLSLSGHNSEDLAKFSVSLEKYLSFLFTDYQFSSHQHFITLYLVPTVQDLRKIAENIHGLDVSPSTIGYSFVDDLSLVAVIPGKLIGTLLHELFHLTVRRDFGDIPQWLDEGMASLYEVSRETDSSFVGKPNWRGKVLKELWDLRPSLTEMITSGWFSYDMPSEYADHTADRESIQRQAVFMAMSRYFILYLQEKQKLNEVFEAFRAMNILEMEDSTNMYTRNIVAGVLQKPIDAVQADFEDWFKSLNN